MHTIIKPGKKLDSLWQEFLDDKGFILKFSDHSLKRIRQRFPEKNLKEGQLILLVKHSKPLMKADRASDDDIFYVKHKKFVFIISEDKSQVITIYPFDLAKNGRLLGSKPKKVSRRKGPYKRKKFDWREHVIKESL